MHPFNTFGKGHFMGDICFILRDKPEKDLIEDDVKEGKLIFLANIKFYDIIQHQVCKTFQQKTFCLVALFKILLHL